MMARENTIGESQMAVIFFKGLWQPKSWLSLFQGDLKAKLRFYSISVLIIVVDGENVGVVRFVAANGVKQDSSLDSSGSIALNFDQLRNVLLKGGMLVCGEAVQTQK